MTHEARKKSQNKYYHRNREEISQRRKEIYKERYYGDHAEERRKYQRERRRTRARKGKTEEEIKEIDERQKHLTARKKEKEHIRNERSFYNKIVKRDINISLLKNKQNITAKEACIAVSCEPAQNYLNYILETNPGLKLNFSKEELKKRLLMLEKRAFKECKIIIPKVAVALVLYRSSYHTQSKIAQICGTTPETIRNYLKKIKSVLKYIKRSEVENESEEN